MSVEGEKQNKLVQLSSNHFLTASNKLQGVNLQLRAKTKVNVKPELKMKIVRNTCEKELDEEMKSVTEKFT